MLRADDDALLEDAMDVRLGHLLRAEPDLTVAAGRDHLAFRRPTLLTG